MYDGNIGDFSDQGAVREYNLYQELPRMEFEVDVYTDKKALSKRNKNKRSKQTERKPSDYQIIGMSTTPSHGVTPTKKKEYEAYSGGHGYKLSPLPTQKNGIIQRPVMEQGIIPKHPSSVIANGKSGSGKTTLLISLLIDSRFYGKGGSFDKHYFDKIYLFSPTAGSCDDLVQQLYRYTPLTEDNTFTSFDEKKIATILDEQKALIDKKGIDKSDRCLILLDDIQSSQEFLRSPTILKLFLENRHYNISTWICSQSYTKTPRGCRLQANNIFYFKGSATETDRIIDEYSPNGMSKQDFKFVLNKYVFKEPFDFLHYNVRRDKKYSRNLDEMLDV